MSQRVNIQYSVEIDKLPDTVSVLYDNAMLRMKHLNETMLNLNFGLDLEMVDQIDAIRLELAQIDIQLADVETEDRFVHRLLFRSISSGEECLPTVVIYCG